MSLETAAQQQGPALVGDLHSASKPERRLFGQDQYALEWIIPHCGLDRPFFENVLRDSLDLMRQELMEADHLLDALLLRSLGSQFRSRPDKATGKLAIEQWIPALDSWMVNGFFDPSTPYHNIVSTLEAGDPRKKTSDEHLAEQRDRAAAQRAANDAASTDKVMGAVDAMTSRQVENFVAVEQALHTGDSIALRGEDRRTMERLVEDTRKAAHQGDGEAQAVLTRGQRDNPTCLLPSTNPLRHRHRKELIPGTDTGTGKK